MDSVKAHLNMANNRSMIILFLVAGLFILIAYGVYKYVILPRLNPDFVANNEYDKKSDDIKKAQILFFTAKWCPHCKKAEPEWNIFKNKLNNGGLKDQTEKNMINGIFLSTNTIDCTNINYKDAKELNEYNTFENNGSEQESDKESDKTLQATVDEAKELVEKYNVEGFPTCIMVKGDEVVEYDSKISNEGLEKFVNEVLK